MEGLAVLVMLIAALFYFVPAIVAGTREHHQTFAIVILNIVGGWTLVGWVVALVWACTEVKPRVITPAPFVPLFPQTPRMVRHPIASR
jgi:hypothetical protein